MEKAKADSAAAAVRRFHARPTDELYDLRTDTWELRNLAADPARAEALKKFGADLDGWMAEQGDGELKTERPLAAQIIDGGRGHT